MQAQGSKSCPANVTSMQHHFTTKPLTSQLVQRTYPFAQALGLQDLAGWRNFVESFASGEARAAGDGALDSGAIVAENPHGYVCGVLFYQVNRHNKDGASLVCDPFLVADLPRYETPIRTLLQAADRIAVDRSCRWVRIVLPANGDPLSADAVGCESALFRAGYALESVSFRRRRALPVRPVRSAPESKENCKPRTNGS